MRSRYSAYSGTSWREGMSWAVNVTFSTNSGCCSRKMSKAVKPRRTFLERSARSTRRIEYSRWRRRTSCSSSLTAVALAERPGGLVVDRQRVGADPRLVAVLAAHDAGLHVDLDVVEQVAAALQEVAPVGAGVEADDVVGQQPAVDLGAHLRREHAPGVRLGPRDVDEVVQEDVGLLAPDDLRQRVEVVVVDHHDRVLLVGDLLQHGLREVVVDGLVAVLERLDLVAADVRRVALVPEVVLDEPEHRVGDDVVEAVVGLVVGLDEAHAERAALGRLDLERVAAVLARDLDVLLGHRGGDPDRVAVRGQARQRGHEPAGPALDRAVVLIGDGPPVGDQDEWAGARSSAARGRQRTLAQLDLDLLGLAAAVDLDRHVLAGLELGHDRRQVVGVLDRPCPRPW